MIDVKDNFLSDRADEVRIFTGAQYTWGGLAGQLSQ